MIRTAVILSTGDELVTGLTVDTNSNYLATKLIESGVDLVGVHTVGDDPERIRWAIESGFDRADLVLSTGGLGPTADDLTTDVVADTFGLELKIDDAEVERIRGFFESRGRQMPENNVRQARFPVGSTRVPNDRGTAAGYRLDVDWKGQTRHLIVMPGVPSEMHAMVEETVLPWIRSLDESGDVYRTKSFQTFGATESGLDAMLEGAIPPQLARLSFRAQFPQIGLRLTVHGSPEATEARIAEGTIAIRERVGDFIFGEGDTSMEEVVVSELRRRGWRLALAESCTGGLVANRITEVSGSSEVFSGGWVTYTNEMKQSALGVPAMVLDEHGPVSEATACAMAEGARERSGADLAVAVTGIAGPGGGTDENPVGTVWIALAAADGTVARRYPLWGERHFLKMLASQVALDWVRRKTHDEDPRRSLRGRRR